MADNPTVAGISWAANDIASVFYQRSKISLGAPGSASDWLLGQQNMASSAPVVIASNQSAVPVSGPVTDAQLRASAVPVSGPLTDAQLRASAVPVSQASLPGIKADLVAAATASWTSATALNTALSLAVSGYTTVLLSLNPTTTFTNGILTFEVSDDGGTTWYPIQGVRLDSFTAEPTYAIVASTTRVWQFNVAGATNFRARLSTVIAGTGTAALRVQASAAARDPFTAIALAPATSGTPAVATVTTGAVVTIAAANASRKFITLTNDSDTDIYLSPANTVSNTGTNSGDILYGRTRMVFNGWSGAIYAIAKSGSAANGTIRSWEGA